MLMYVHTTTLFTTNPFHVDYMFSLQKSPKTISGHDDSEAKSHSTSVWASTDGGYDKPWKANAKQTTGTAKLNKSQGINIQGRISVVFMLSVLYYCF